MRATGAHIKTQKRAPAAHLHVKKGDTVLVLSGNDKGKTGEVKLALPRAGRIVVAGINMRWRHKKPTEQNPKGERVQREMSIHASNVRIAEKAGKKAGGAKPAAKKAKAVKSTASKKKS
jgi:large subunit ribosomal protein L24